MTAKHTPGPWMLGRFVSHEKTNEQAVYGKGGELICDAVWGGSLEVSDANAHLIKAAPDLLLACKAARDHIRDEIGQFGARSDYKDTEAIAGLDAAIARAEALGTVP